MATELAKAYIQIVPSAKGIQGALSETLGGEAENAGGHAGGKIASAIKAAIVAAGIGAVIKGALAEGAALEQSIGGIETLFGAKGAKSVEEYAAAVGKSVAEAQNEFASLQASESKMLSFAGQAYRTAGLSANDYMQQATSFAASLLASLDGDTNAAADAANQAIIDMADNANKMGTDIASIQTAYQGFAKQNFTMLDNLKLGYGGTKTEMERLLSDAEKISGIKYDISNLNDVYSAIHVIQNELGITGTTATEAASTLAGSFASMKAAASNFLGNLALGKDVEASLRELIESASTFLFRNLMPAVGNIIKALPGAIGVFLSEGLPALLRGGIDIVRGLVDGMGQGGENLKQGIKELIQSLTKSITNHLPEIIKLGIELVVNLALGVIQAVPELIAALPELSKAMWDGLLSVDWLGLGVDIMKGIINGIKSMGAVLLGAVKDAASSALNGVKQFLGISSPSKKAEEEIGAPIPMGAARGVAKNARVLQDAMREMSASTVLRYGDYGVPQMPGSTQKGNGDSIMVDTLLKVAATVVEAINRRPVPKFVIGDRELAAATANGANLIGHSLIKE